MTHYLLYLGMYGVTISSMGLVWAGTSIPYEMDGEHRVIQNQVFTEEIIIDGTEWDGAIIRQNIFRNQKRIALIVRNTRDVRIEDNEFYGMRHFALLLPKKQTRGTDNIIIKNNYFHDMPYTALHTKEPNRNTKIIGNTFENITVRSWGHKRHAIYVKGPDALIEGNIIRRVADAHGISIRSSGIVRRNWIEGAKDHAIKLYTDSEEQGQGTLLIENNIILNCRGGIGLDDGGQGSLDRTIIRFNTFVDNRWDIWLDSSMSQMIVEIYGNIFKNVKGRSFDFEFLPAIETENLKLKSNIGFKDARHEDFHLKEQSRAIDKVKNPPDIPERDFDGVSFLEAPYDAGAFQE